MARRVIIGKVSVKVYPDTSEFRREAERELSAVEKTLRDVKVGVELDDDGLSRDAKAAAERAERAVQKIKLRFDTEDNASLKKALDRVDRELQKLREVSLDVKLDEESLQAARETLEDHLHENNRVLQFEVARDVKGLKEVRAQVEKLLRDQNQIKFEVENDEDAMRAFKKRMDELIEHYDGKDVEIDPDISFGPFQYAKARLAELSRDRIVHLHPLVNGAAMRVAESALARLSGFRMVQSTLQNVWDMFKNMDRMVPLLGSIALAVEGLAATGLRAVANLFSLSRSLASIGQVGLALPGILTGLATGAVVAAVGLSQFNKHVPEVSKSFDRMKKSIDTNFWKKAGDPLRELAKSILPTLEDAVKETATASGTYFGNLAKSMQTFFSPRLKSMFDHVSESILISAEGTDAFAEAISILGDRGGAYLPRLSKWFNKLGEDFAGWLRDAEESGKLDRLFEQGIAAAKDFGSVIRSTFSTFGNIAKAAKMAGGATLDSLAKRLQKIDKITESAKFQKHLVEAFTAAHNIFQDIARISGPSVTKFFENLTGTMLEASKYVGPAIGSIVKGAADALSTSGFQDGVVELFKGIERGVQELEPVWEPLGNAIGKVLEMIGHLAEEFAPLLAKVLGYVSEAIDRLSPYIEKAVTALSEGLGGALDVVAPLVIDLAEAILQLITPLLECPAAIIGVVTALGLLKGALAAVKVANTLGALTGAIPKLGGAASKATPIIAGFGKALGVIGGVIVGTKVLGHLVDLVDGANAVAPSVDTATASLKAMADQVSRPDTTSNLFAFGKAIHDIDSAMIQMTGWRGKLNDVGMWIDNALGTKMSDQATATKQAFENIGTALTNLVQQGNIAEAERQFNALYSQVDQTKRSKQDLLNMMPGFKAAMEQAAQAEKVEAAAAAEAAQAAHDLGLNMAEMPGLTPQVAASIQEASQAFIDLDGALGEAYTGLDDYLAKLDEQVQAQAAWADNMVELAKRGVSEGMLKELARLGPEGSQLVADLRTGSDEQLRQFEEAVAARMDGASNEVLRQLGILEDEATTEAGNVATGAADALGRMESDFKKKGENGTNGLIAGLVSLIASVTGAGRDLGNKGAEGAGGTTRSWSTAGANIAAGLASGIGSAVRTVVTAATSLAGAALRAFKERMGINSPSRVMMEQGAYVGQGAVLGVLSQLDAMAEAGRKLGDAVRDEMETSPIEVPLELAGDLKLARRAIATVESDGADAGGDDSHARVVVHQTIHNPIAEPSSEAVNAGLQLAAALGI